MDTKNMRDIAESLRALAAARQTFDSDMRFIEARYRLAEAIHDLAIVAKLEAHRLAETSSRLPGDETP